MSTDPISRLLTVCRGIVDAPSSREAERLLPDLAQALEPAERSHRRLLQHASLEAILRAFAPEGAFSVDTAREGET